MEKDFIHRSLKISIIVAIIFIPFLFAYFGISIALGFMAGAAWNIINVFLLHKVTSMTVLPPASNRKWGVLAGILKFPVLYGIGYAILRYTQISLYGIMSGFSLVLLIFVLKALGVYLNHFFCQGARNYGRGA